MRRLVIPYSIAVGAVAAAVVLRWLLDPIMRDTLPVVTVVGAVAVAVMLGGVGPAVLATLLGYVAVNYLFMPPRHTLTLGSAETVVGFFAYLLTCVIIIGFGAAMRASRRRFDELASQASAAPPTLPTIEAIRRRHGLRDFAFGGFVLTLAVLVAAGALGYRNVRRLDANDRLVSRTHEVLGQLQTLEATVTDAETDAESGRSGFLVSADPKYLRPYEDAMSRVTSIIARLRALTADNPAQHARLAELEQRANARISELHRTVELASRGDRQGARAIVQSGSVKVLMDDLRARVADMANVEQGLLRQRATESEVSASTATLWIVLGAVIGVLLVCVVFYLTQRNIRLRQEAVESVAEQRELLRVTLASIGDAVITTDLEGRVTYLNAVAQELTEWKLEDAAGQPLDTVFRILNEKTRETVKNPALRALQEGAVIGLAGHTILTTKHGIERPIDSSAAPIKDDQGRIAGCVLIFRDIADRKAADARIHELVKALQDGDRRKDEFLAILSHELRGPLAPLGNVLEILRRASREDGTMRQVRGTIERQVGQLARLVDDLLDVSRITRGRLQLRRERVELGSVLRQAIETCRPLADARQQQITLTMPPNPIYLEADRARLAQVFYNLLHNATKYTPPFGHIWALAELQAGDIVVRVKDNGLGIEADKLARVFEPFTQGDQSLERPQGGLGIGLTLAQRLTEMHGGSITAASDGAGKGSEFTVRVPIGRPAPPPPSPPPASVTAPSWGKRADMRRVLIVDDNRDSATSLAILLSMSGNETHLAHDGLEAVGAAEKLRPDVVVLDIGMPHLNGYDACRQIRAQPWGKNMVLVAVTGWGQPEDRRQALEAGFDHHMVKPVDHAALAKVLSRVDRTA